MAFDFNRGLDEARRVNIDRTHELEAEHDRLAAALSTIRLMANNYAGMADDDDWGGDYLREIRDYAESALRGEEQNND